MPCCKEFEIQVLERMDAPLDRATEQKLQNHIGKCLSCRQFSRRMQKMKTQFQILPKVEASPYFLALLRQRIRKDYRLNNQVILPMMLSLERWIPIMGIAALLLLTGAWLLTKHPSTANARSAEIDAVELQYVLEEPINPSSPAVMSPDSLFRNAQASEARIVPVSF
jgi:predicted anti-sigma-YlaC factor YlaD